MVEKNPSTTKYTKYTKKDKDKKRSDKNNNHERQIKRMVDP